MLAPPSLSGSADEQLNANLYAADATARMNRVNQSNPYGSVKYTAPTEEGGLWSQETTLNPGEQSNLDAQRGLTSDALAQGSRRLGMLDESPVDASAFSGPNSDTTNQLYGAYTSRLDPTFDRLRNETETRLANQGLNVGSEAYKNEFGIFNEGRNDAYTQALQRAIEGGISENQNAFNRTLTSRDQSLDELSSVMGLSGGVNDPQFSSVPGVDVQSPDILGAEALKLKAETDNRNREAQERSDNLAAASGLGGAVVSAVAPKLIDRLMGGNSGGGGGGVGDLVLPAIGSKLATAAYGAKTAAGGANLGMLAQESASGAASGAGAGGGYSVAGAGAGAEGAGVAGEAGSGAVAGSTLGNFAAGMGYAGAAMLAIQLMSRQSQINPAEAAAHRAEITKKLQGIASGEPMQRQVIPNPAIYKMSPEAFEASGQPEQIEVYDGDTLDHWLLLGDQMGINLRPALQGQQSQGQGGYPADFMAMGRRI